MLGNGATSREAISKVSEITEQQFYKNRWLNEHNDCISISKIMTAVTGRVNQQCLQK